MTQNPHNNANHTPAIQCHQNTPDHLRELQDYICFPDESYSQDDPYPVKVFNPKNPDNFHPSLLDHQPVPYAEPSFVTRQVSTRTTWTDPDAPSPTTTQLSWPPPKNKSQQHDNLHWIEINEAQAHYRLAHKLSPQVITQLACYSNKSTHVQPPPVTPQPIPRANPRQPPIHSRFHNQPIRYYYHRPQTHAKRTYLRPIFQPDSTELLATKTQQPHQSHPDETREPNDVQLPCSPPPQPNQDPIVPLTPSQLRALHHTALPLIPQLTKTANSYFQHFFAHTSHPTELTHQATQTVVTNTLETITAKLSTKTLSCKDLLNETTWFHELNSHQRRYFNLDPATELRKPRQYTYELDPVTQLPIPKPKETYRTKQPLPDTLTKPEYPSHLDPDQESQLLQTITAFCSPKKRDTHYELLQTIYSNPDATQQELAVELNVHPRTIERRMAALREDLNHLFVYETIVYELALLRNEKTDAQLS